MEWTLYVTSYYFLYFLEYLRVSTFSNDNGCIEYSFSKFLENYWKITFWRMWLSTRPVDIDRKILYNYISEKKNYVDIVLVYLKRFVNAFLWLKGIICLSLPKSQSQSQSRATDRKGASHPFSVSFESYLFSCFAHWHFVVYNNQSLHKQISFNILIVF